MRLGEWRRRTDYWVKHPPACELLEILVGRGAGRVEAREPTVADMRELQSMMGGQ